MDDEKIIQNGGTQEDIENYATSNGANLTEKDYNIEVSIQETVNEMRLKNIEPKKLILEKKYMDYLGLKTGDVYMGMDLISDEDVIQIHSKDKEIIRIHEHRNELKRCPYCNSSIMDRKVSLHKELVSCLYKIYVWCGQNKRHEFHVRDVKHLMGKSDYARFGDFVRFGGLVYRPKDDDGKREKGWFGLNMARCKEFFKGERTIPMFIILDQITNEIIDSNYISVYDFQELSTFIDKNGLYDYSKDFNPEQGSLI